MSDGNGDERRASLGVAGLVSAFILIGAICAIVGYSVASDTIGRKQAPHEHEISAQNNAESACAGLQSRALFECIYDEVGTSYQAANAEQDLEAQQTMARWTWVMGFTALIALGITGAGVYYVAQTLDATKEAVRETAKATGAMVRQNDIAEAAQRPWVAISFRPVSIDQRDHRFEIAWELSFQNLGRTIAQNLNMRFVLHFVGENEPDREVIQGKWQEWRRAKKEVGNVGIMPGETLTFPGWGFYRKESQPWIERKGSKFLCPILVVAIYYRIPGDDKWQVVERAFSIGTPGIAAGNEKIPWHDRKMMYPKDLIARPYTVGHIIGEDGDESPQDRA